MKFYKNMLELVGNTPIIKLQKITKKVDANIYVKCEYFNPSGSIKDRIALKMVEEAEKEGELKKGGVIVEVTSGNTGPALAFVGAVKGYKVHIFIPSQWTGTYNPEDRVKTMKIYGAKVTPFLTEKYEEIFQGLSENEAAAATIAVGLKECYEFEKRNNLVWWPNQLCNRNNVLAHKESTGKEIIEQLNGEIDAWVASVGTGGTLLGVAEALKEEIGNVKTVAVEPEDARVTEWAEKKLMSKFMKQLNLPQRKSIMEIALEKGVPDKVIRVSHEEARKMANKLCKEEGLFCGISSGANVYAALKAAKEIGEGANIVTVLVDSRDRYFPEYPNEQYTI